MRAIAKYRTLDPDYDRVVADLEAADAAGHLQAKSVLGALLLIYGNRNKASQAIARGKEMIERAAESGDAMAERFAAVGYFGNDFGSPDRAKAMAYMNKAVAASVTSTLRTTPRCWPSHPQHALPKAPPPKSKARPTPRVAPLPPFPSTRNGRNSR